jgi:hypothetical protein
MIKAYFIVFERSLILIYLVAYSVTSKKSFIFFWFRILLCSPLCIQEGRSSHLPSRVLGTKHYPICNLLRESDSQVWLAVFWVRNIQVSKAGFYLELENLSMPRYFDSNNNSQLTYHWHSDTQPCQL